VNAASAGRPDGTALARSGPVRLSAAQASNPGRTAEAGLRLRWWCPWSRNARVPAGRPSVATVKAGKGTYPVTGRLVRAPTASQKDRVNFMLLSLAGINTKRKVSTILPARGRAARRCPVPRAQRVSPVAMPPSSPTAAAPAIVYARFTRRSRRRPRRDHGESV